VPLRTTYADSNVHHDRWRDVYRRNPSQRRFDDEIYRWLSQQIQPRGSWLDAGCGSGEHSIRLARLFADVLAVDLSPKVLKAAAEEAERQGLSDRIRYQCHALEELPPGLESTNVHCRGVIMHIPAWREALRNISRCVKPGGYLILCENDRRSVEAWLVMGLRRILRRRSRVEVTEGGLEFWSEPQGKPFVVRMANLDALESTIRECGIKPLFRRSVALFDLNRFPRPLRAFVVQLNRAWFRLNLPFASGVLIVAQRDVV
jgi:2-polyprenyl-3-methyl-5-hydroxy-6-metoxy-1,4-benzoquinol methylase